MTTASHFSLLVVDDEPDLRTLYELTLLREGYDIETAGTVEEALMHLKDRTYSAVITDMRLPDGTGLDLLRRLEEGGRREKAIVITAYGSAENAVEALKAGAYDYLTKPVDLKQFRAVIASALGRGGTGVPTMDPTSLPSEHGTPDAPRAPRVASAPAAPVSQALTRMAGQSVAMHHVRTLVEKVLQGEEVIFQDHGKPVARVEALPTHGGTNLWHGFDMPEVEPDERFPEIAAGVPLQERRIGGAPGFVIQMAEDFNAPVEDFGDL